MKKNWFASAVAVWGMTVLMSAPAGAQTTHIVTTSGFDFVPENITIQAGDSIMWTDLQAAFHNVVETDCPTSSSSTSNGGFDSGIAGGVDTFTVQFNDAGTFCYICEPHVSLGMVGSITVEEVTPVPTLDEWGLIAMGALLLFCGVRALR